MKAKRHQQTDSMRAEYDFDYGTCVRGKYHRRLLREGSNVVVLDPDVAERFRSSEAVNEALRELANASLAKPRRTSGSGKPMRKKVGKTRR